ncbi:MAG: Ig-like domain-containing protein [Caldilineales bacterium]
MTATLVYSDAVAQALTTLSQTLPLLIDADEPASTVTSPANGAAINGTAYVIGGTASDPTSWPRLVETRVTGGGYDTGWQAATGTTTWAWTWTPLPADGLYTVQSRATDYVFNLQSSPTTSSIIVDNTAPGASFSNLADGDALQISGNTVTIQGAATDLLSGAAQVAGLQTVQLSIDGRPWRNVDEYLSAPHPATADWQFSWTVDAAAYGSHTLQVRAVDALGQIGDPTEITVVIDTLPPTDIWSNYAPYLPAGQSVALLGHADDEGNVPLPARPQALENTLDAVLSATVRLMPEAYTDTVGMTVTWLGDVNGDARADLAVGMPAATVDGMSGAGRVSVVYGQPGGWPVPPQSVALPDATTSFVGSSDNAQLGQVVGPAGDVNSDGLSDILVGDPAANRVYVVYGSAGGVGQDFNLSTLATGQNGALGRTYTSSLGQVGTWASAGGDVNGDGFDDILVGVTGLGGGSAALYLLPGGPATGAAGVLDVSSQALETFQLDNNGAAATGVGDVNDDQYDDFVLADPNGSFGGGPAVYLFLGPPAWRQPGETGPLNPATHADASFAGQSGVGSQVVALGDVDGDSLPDFAYSDGTTPKVVYGRTSGWTAGMAPSVTFSGSTAFDSFISAPGDVNADGINDVLLGSSSAGGSAFLYHGRPDLATNQPVQAEIGGVSSAASAPYAAGADLNCDLSSDLLVVPVGETLTVDSADGSLRVRDQRIASNQQGQWIGPAPAPFDLRDLPEAGSLSPARASYAAGRAADVSASLTTPALAFRVVGDNIDDWSTDAAMVGDFDGDGKTDIAGWSNTTATNEPEAAADTQASEDVDATQTATDTNSLDASAAAVEARQAATDTTPLENTLDIQEAEAPAAGWRIWHSDGYSTELSFTEYSNNLPAAVTGSTTRLVADFDGDHKTDVGYWDGSQWQFVRSDGEWFGVQLHSRVKQPWRDRRRRHRPDAHRRLRRRRQQRHRGLGWFGLGDVRVAGVGHDLRLLLGRQQPGRALRQRRLAPGGWRLRRRRHDRCRVAPLRQRQLDRLAVQRSGRRRTDLQRGHRHQPGLRGHLVRAAAHRRLQRRRQERRPGAVRQHGLLRLAVAGGAGFGHGALPPRAGQRAPVQRLLPHRHAGG